MTRRAALAAALAGAAATGSVLTIALGGAAAAPAAPNPPRLSTARVVRTDLSTTAVTEGTLGYAPTDPVVNRVEGTYTAVPAAGTVVRQGDVLYRVDDAPVVEMAGAIPAWRAFAPNMSDGPDVAELQDDLVALGDARGLYTSGTGHFDADTAAAIMRWQAARDMTSDGRIALGTVVFEPGPVRVGAVDVAPGQVAAPGDVPFSVTTTDRVVSVPVNPDLPDVSMGEEVSIVLPDTTTTPGHVTAIGPPDPGSPGAAPSSSGAGGSGAPGTQAPTTVLTVTPDHPGATGTGEDVAVQVSLTSQSATAVLAVPISALLALAGGGYGVEVVERSGRHRLVGVTTGVFGGSRVEVRGRALGAGTTVVVAQ